MGPGAEFEGCRPRKSKTLQYTLVIEPLQNISTMKNEQKMCLPHVPLFLQKKKNFQYIT